MAKLAPWPFPSMTPEQFYSLDSGLQRQAARMAESFILATFKIAQEDANAAMNKAKFVPQKARRVRPKNGRGAKVATSHVGIAGGQAE